VVRATTRIYSELPARPPPAAQRWYSPRCEKPNRAAQRSHRARSGKELCSHTTRGFSAVQPLQGSVVIGCSSRSPGGPSGFRPPGGIRQETRGKLALRPHNTQAGQGARATLAVEMAPVQAALEKQAPKWPTLDPEQAPQAAVRERVRNAPRLGVVWYWIGPAAFLWQREATVCLQKAQGSRGRRVGGAREARI